MTGDDITLFNKGLVESKGVEVCHDFPVDIKDKIVLGWDSEEQEQRTEKAIDFVSKFVPTFSSVTVGGPPLYGVQQIPGDDPSLRVGEFSCEVLCPK